MKKLTKLFACYCGFCLGLFFCCDPGLAMEATASTGTNVNPAIYDSLNGQKVALTRYPILYEACFDMFSDEKDEGTYVIPGLIRTETINVHKEVEECTKMVPQGITIADDYVMISAYCYEHKHNSVVYILNKHSHLFIKTVVLNTRAHVGGLAYDPICRNLWVATKNFEKDHGSISSLRLAAIDQYNFYKTKKPIAFDYVQNIPELKNTTFATYYGGEIYCGTLDRAKKELSIYIYRIDPWSGKINPRLTHSIRVAGSDYMGDYCQGMAINNDYIVLSASNGPNQQSSLAFFKKNENYFLNGKPNKMVNLPPRLEQVSFDGKGNLVLLFESAAAPYKKKESLDIDRVLKGNVEKFLTYSS